jgi:hypothetical protein
MKVGSVSIVYCIAFTQSGFANTSYYSISLQFGERLTHRASTQKKKLPRRRDTNDDDDDTTNLLNSKEVWIIIMIKNLLIHHDGTPKK